MKCSTKGRDAYLSKMSDIIAKRGREDRFGPPPMIDERGGPSRSSLPESVILYWKLATQ